MNQPQPHRKFVGSIPAALCLVIGSLLAWQHSTTSLQANPLLTRDPNFFPLGVWLQHPNNAPRYQAAGFNTYVSLWRGPTEAQLTALQSTGMRIVCAQNSIALNHPNRTNIIAWMHEDEPDNSRQRGARLGLGVPTTPEQLAAEYQRMKTTDPTRPVFLNLGQGVAWENWYGRGMRNRHPEDYPRYLESCDLASFDIYPVNHPSPEVAGNLWYVPHGIEQLRRWSADTKPVWNLIECTTIDLPGRKPTPTEVRAQVWMSLIHGSRGIIYFAHQFQPVFREAALLDDPEMLVTVSNLNQQISTLAPVLNSPTITNLITVQSKHPALPIATMTKRHAGKTYLFAVAMRPLETEATFQLPDVADGTKIEVLGENRSLTITNGSFGDHFKPWAVHLYKISPAQR